MAGRGQRATGHDDVHSERRTSKKQEVVDNEFPVDLVNIYY